MAIARKAGGHFAPGKSPNPGGKPRGHRSYLRGLLGQNGERAFEILLRIAEGELTFEALARKPGADEDAVSAALIPKVTVQPTIRERLDAARILIEHTVGKPVSTVEIEASSTAGQTDRVRDYHTLSDAELVTLEATLRKAAEGRPSPAADAEIEAKALPAPEGES